MPVDLQRIIEAAAQAALADSSSDQGRGNRKRSERRRRRRLRGTRAFLIGAGVVTAGRMVSAARRGDLLEGIQQRLLEYEHRHFGDETEVESPEDLEADDVDEDDRDEDDRDEDDEDRPAAASRSVGDRAGDDDS